MKKETCPSQPGTFLKSLVFRVSPWPNSIYNQVGLCNTDLTPLGPL